MTEPQLAILGGAPVRRGKKAPRWPVSGEEEMGHVREVLDSSMWSRYLSKKETGGPGDKVTEFERRFCEFLGAQHGIAVTNGTAALEVACRAIFPDPGDEIITPAHSFVASATCAFAARAIPVFVDLDPETLCISPDRIEEAITPRTRAIIAVHLDGYLCDMDRIMAIAEKHGLVVIEDCARSHGSEWRGRKAGSIGHFGCFSFWNSKQMTCGEGGFVSSNDDQLSAAAASIANQGRTAGGGQYEHSILGCNERMNQISAAVMLGQLSRLPSQIAHREENIACLERLIEKQPGFRHVRRDPRATCQTYFFAVFHYDPAEFQGVPRTVFSKAMQAEGVPLQVGVDSGLYANALFSREGLRANKIDFLYRDHGRTIDYETLRFPVTEDNNSLRIQHRWLLGPKSDMEEFAAAVRKIHENAGELAAYASQASEQTA